MSQPVTVLAPSRHTTPRASGLQVQSNQRRTRSGCRLGKVAVRSGPGNKILLGAMAGGTAALCMSLSAVSMAMSMQSRRTNALVGALAAQSEAQRQAARLMEQAMKPSVRNTQTSNSAESFPRQPRGHSQSTEIEIEFVMDPTLTQQQNQGKFEQLLEKKLQEAAENGLLGIPQPSTAPQASQRPTKHRHQHPDGAEQSKWDTFGTLRKFR